MNVTQLKKAKGKSFPIPITFETQKRIYSFKNRLNEMAMNKDVDDKYINMIHYILNELDDYDLNLLIAYYELADGKPSRLSKIFDVDPNNIKSRINKIIKTCQQSLI